MVPFPQVSSNKLTNSGGFAKKKGGRGYLPASPMIPITPSCAQQLMPIKISLFQIKLKARG